MVDCIFCKLISGELPSYKIFEDDKYLVILDRFPTVKGMTMVITKNHLSSYFAEVEDEILSEMMALSKKIAKQLDSKLEGVLRTMLEVEGLDVDHLHFKLLPAYENEKIDHLKRLELSDDEMEEIRKEIVGESRALV